MDSVGGFVLCSGCWGPLPAHPVSLHDTPSHFAVSNDSLHSGVHLPSLVFPKFVSRQKLCKHCPHELMMETAPNQSCFSSQEVLLEENEGYVLGEGARGQWAFSFPLPFGGAVSWLTVLLEHASACYLSFPLVSAEMAGLHSCHETESLFVSSPSVNPAVSNVLGVLGFLFSVRLWRPGAPEERSPLLWHQWEGPEDCGILFHAELNPVFFLYTHGLQNSPVW